jgi:hypothetical protein
VLARILVADGDDHAEDIIPRELIALQWRDQHGVCRPIEHNTGCTR